ncbi:DUF4097 family beta strand repeat-containing protein [Myceligenerans pegani]|uniref:DUF4097 family beta strand repeat protein n=1 Tax=Myceligenerans pegani TaxID=2776917 RepID=A0ABR9N262_9MICO|nr:DUF4097 family beta strand repeat-containing protein [Myceligenerans sp. TRM 65318]MBE1877361.1 DUF4097 family beta strand repeat protein [Myceligenerans sp. TRM 65318]MBE3019632.1 DUF4097 family beta strand repeat protein [Myceligenerans sp. TRM 65318]
MTEQHWTVTGPQTIEVDEVTTVHAHLVDGRLDVVAHEDPVTRVEVHSVDGRPVEVTFRDGHLVVGHEPNTSGGLAGFLRKWTDFGGNARADIHIAVPARVDTKIGTVRAEALVSGTEGEAKVSTASGSLLVSRTRGPLTLTNVSGDATVRDHEGPITSTTVSGDVVLSGAVEHLTSSTVSGDVTMDLTTQPDWIKTNSVSGDLLVRVPDEAVVEVHASAISGRVTVGGMQVSGRGGAVVRSARPERTHLRVSTVSGDVTVLGTSQHVSDDGPGPAGHPGVHGVRGAGASGAAPGVSWIA